MYSGSGAASIVSMRKTIKNSDNSNLDLHLWKTSEFFHPGCGQMFIQAGF